MSCQGFDIQLGDYVDGALDAAARETFEAHLATCQRCHALAADFQIIRRTAAALEPHTPPAAAWTRLAAVMAQPPAPRWWWQGGSTVWQPAAALAMVVLLTSSLMWVGGRLTPVAETGRAASARTTAPAPLANPDLQVAATDISSAIDGLDKIRTDGSDALDQGTADVLQANLTAIDTAIGESRAALATEPENEFALDTFFKALRRKLSLLQDAVALINEMRKGNPEGAARIVSGQNQ